MPRKNIDQASGNYEGSIAFVKDRYLTGLEGADWRTNAGSDNAEKLYADKIQQAISNKSRQKGIKAVSNDDWLNAAKTKGADSIQEGMRQGQEKYTKNFSPILSAMNSAAEKLKPKTADIAANIQNRVLPVAMAAHEASLRK